MVSTLPAMYIAAVVVVGFGTGLYLHFRLQNEHQLTFKLRSPFTAIPTHIEWTAQESHSHA